MILRSRRPRAIEAASAAGGIALVELLVGILVAAAVTAGAFAASLSSRIALRKSDNRAQADAAGKVILDTLANYQVPDPFANSIPVSWAPVLPGTSTHCWTIPAAGAPTTCPPGAWALAITGSSQDATGLLPQALQGAGWTATYTVTDGGGGARQVQVQVSWPNDSTGT